MDDTVFPIIGSNYLCEQDWFQEFAVKIFRDEDGKEMLNRFMTMFEENSLTNHGDLPYQQVCFKDGFRHFIRQAHLAVLYWEEKQKRGKDERSSRTSNRNRGQPTSQRSSYQRPSERARGTNRAST